MHRIIPSLVIIVAAASITIGGTVAFFSDTETSTGNVFASGAIDLQVDNDTYYNGEYIEDLSFLQKDLETGDLFYEFNDVKPGDWGENTISLHVFNNDSWLCSNISVSSSEENGIGEPETTDGDITPEGELHQSINFIYWADDGDNVLESNEDVLEIPSLLSIASSTVIPLADSIENIWTGTATPFAPNETAYLGAGWCFGELTLQKVIQDGETDGSVNNPTVDPGFLCDGSNETNITQTDSLEIDLTFESMQSRHNADFVCEEREIVEPISCSIYTESRRLRDLDRNPIENPTVALDGDIRIYTVQEALLNDQCMEFYSRGSELDQTPRDIWEFTVDDDGVMDISVEVGNTVQRGGGTPIPVTDPYEVRISIQILRNGEASFEQLETILLSGTGADIISHDFADFAIEDGETVRIRQIDFVGRPATDALVEFSS